MSRTGAQENEEQQRQQQAPLLPPSAAASHPNYNSVDVTTAVTIEPQQQQISAHPSQKTLEEIFSRWRILNEVLSQAVPNASRGLVIGIRGFSTAFFLGKINEDLLAAYTLIAVIESLSIVLGTRTLTSISSTVGKAFGASNKTEISEDQREAHRKSIGATVRQGYVLAVIISGIIGSLYLFVNHRALHALGQHEFAVEEARKYFQAAAPGYLALMLFTTQQRFFQGTKCPNTVLTSQIFLTLLTVGFSYPLMFGKLGFPQLALTGAGWAYTAAATLTLVIHTLYMRFSTPLNQFALFDSKDTLNFPKIFTLAKIGFNSGIQYASENLAHFINSLFQGRFGGLAALKADQIAFQVGQFVSFMVAGLGGAISTLVSNSLGNERYTNLRRIVNLSIPLGFIPPALFFVLSLFLHQSFTSIFLNIHNPQNAPIVELAKHFLFWECGLRQLATGTQTTTGSALQGIQDTLFPMLAVIGFPILLNLGLLFLFQHTFNLMPVSTIANTSSVNISTNSTTLNIPALETLYWSKAIGFFLAALFNMGRWLMKSHEVSSADKEEIKDMSAAGRFCRGVRLFIGCNNDASIQPVLAHQATTATTL